jgi:hypothetical protein
MCLGLSSCQSKRLVDTNIDKNRRLLDLIIPKIVIENCDEYDSLSEVNRCLYSVDKSIFDDYVVMVDYRLLKGHFNVNYERYGGSFSEIMYDLCRMCNLRWKIEDGVRSPEDGEFSLSVISVSPVVH